MQPVHYLDLLGKPFKRGGRGPDEYDCYGLVIEMFRRDGVTVPDFKDPGELEGIEALVSLEETKWHSRWRRVPIGTVNSLVTLRVEGLAAHVGYVIKPDRFIHAWEPTGVTTERLRNGSFHVIAGYVYE